MPMKKRTRQRFIQIFTLVIAILFMLGVAGFLLLPLVRIPTQ